MKKASFITSVTAAAILVPFLIPRECTAQQERKVSEITPIGSPLAIKTIHNSPVPQPVTETKIPEAAESDPVDLRNAPKSKETAVRDSVSATELAWTFFDKGKYEKSQEWFTLALEWYPGNLHAAEGLVMAMFEGGDPQIAYYVARELNEKIPGIKKLVVESANNRAKSLLEAGSVAEAKMWVTGFPADEIGFADVVASIEKAGMSTALELATVNGAQAGKQIKPLPQVSVNELLTHAHGAMQEGRYRVSQWYLGQAEARAPLSRESLKLKAWNFYHTRQFDLGAAIFEMLYRGEADLESGEGLAFCLQQAQDFDKLTNLSNELGGMLISTASPMIQSSLEKQVRETATNQSVIANSENQALPQYAPTAALEAAGERGAIEKPITERLQARR